jgi:uncharacterized protein with ParB-like and HNH nuclease domain
MENENLYKNLVTFLKMFKNRPYHLAKYLIENSALQRDFIKKISENEKLNTLSDNDKNPTPIYFTEINKMNDYYNSFIDELKYLNENKSLEEIEKDMNIRLENFLKDEKYEDAARLRDYMMRNKIKRYKN